MRIASATVSMHGHFPSPHDTPVHSLLNKRALVIYVRVNSRPFYAAIAADMNASRKVELVSE